MDRYCKENKCFTCGEKGHSYRACPKKTAKKDNPQATMVHTKPMCNQDESRLCYARGKIRDQDSLILFDPGSTHNFISKELATKLGIHEHEMGYAMDAKGAFVGQKVSVKPLIGKLRIHVQGYVDWEDFFISPLQHQDVLLGMPWFHRMRAKLSLPNRVISFKYDDKEVSLKVDEKGHTIPIVSQVSLHKSMKSAAFAYMVFVKDKSESATSFSNNNNLSQEEIEQKVFLDEFFDCFTNSIPGALPPSRGEDDHKIDLIPGTTPPNKPPYRVSLAQQEEIMAQVNELVEKGMVQPSSSPFCSPVLLVQKKDGSYRMCGLSCTKQEHYQEPFFGTKNRGFV